jgi:DNA invertase Pin-like site-specific DNA recombinase
MHARRVSVVARGGLAFDLATPSGRMMAAVLGGVAQFERELIQERARSGLAAARARGEVLGRRPGQRPSDRVAHEVVAMVEDEGLSYRAAARRLDGSKNTMLAIMKRHRAAGSEATRPA